MEHLVNKFYEGNALMVKRIAFVIVMILLVLLPTAPVHAADLATSCTTLLKGGWSSNVCTIPVGITGEVPSGVTLGVQLGETIDVKGTLNINGSLSLQGGTLSNNGTTNNNGNIDNYSTPTAQQYGLKNYSTFNNNGSITITANTVLYNFGVFINADAKGASLIVKGEFDNLYVSGYSGAFTNQALGSLSLFDSGSYIADQFTSTTNYGKIEINGSNAKIEVYSLTNHGTINNLGGTFIGVDLTNSSTGTMFNDLYANWTCGTSDSSKLDNEGSFTNLYYLYINHKCVFTNKSGATFLNKGITYIGENDGTAPFGKLLNQGTVTNSGESAKIILTSNGTNTEGVYLLNDNDAVITNAQGGVIELGLYSGLYNTGTIEHLSLIHI